MKDIGGAHRVYEYRQRLKIDADTREWHLDDEMGIFAPYMGKVACQRVIRGLIARTDKLIDPQA